MAKKEVTAIPDYTNRDKSGALRKFKRGDFPRTAEGVAAWYDYSEAVLKQRVDKVTARLTRAAERMAAARADALAGTDPRKKLEKQIARERARLQKLEERWAALGGK